MKRLSGIIRMLVVFLVAVGGAASCSNPSTKAGEVGYITRGAWIGKASFYGTQMGPTSTGLGWLLYVTNVSVTPYTFSEDFTGEESVLSKDNLKIGFRVHIVFKVNADQVQNFVEKFTTLHEGDTSDKVVLTAYQNYLKEPLRTYARDQIQRLNGLDIKDQIGPVGEAIFARVLKLTAGTPFDVSSVVVGNIQYPKEVADAVSEKMASTQILERKKIEIEIEEQEKEKRIVQAEGIARATEIIRGQLNPMYLQHEAIEAQKLAVNSPNHTVIYIPVGQMGVPLTGTFDAASGGVRDKKKAEDKSEKKEEEKK